jgi:hypothetical protein
MQTPQEKYLVRFDLSSEQRERIKRLTGRDSEALELTVEELEERIAPRLSSNHNETLLAGR